MMEYLLIVIGLLLLVFVAFVVSSRIAWKRQLGHARPYGKPTLKEKLKQKKKRFFDDMDFRKDRSPSWSDSTVCSDGGSSWSSLFSGGGCGDWSGTFSDHGGCGVGGDCGCGGGHV